MALPGRLKPIGKLAETVADIAEKTLAAPNSAAAQKALKAAEPDFAAVLHNSNFEELVGRLFKITDSNIVGDSALQALVALHGTLENRGLRVTMLDLSRCLEKMLQVQTGRGGLKFSSLSAALGTAADRKERRQAYISFFSGELRERVVQHLLSVRILADVLTNEAKLRAKAAGIKLQNVKDTGLIGDVRMPTTPSSGRKPSPNALGPDRMFGFIVPYKKEIDGFAGTFDVTGIIEVKARTGALAGLMQFEKFEIRALHNTINIDGKLYRIECDEARLRRILILPEDAIDRARTIIKAKKLNIDVLPYPAAIEDIITQQSKDVVDSMLNLARLMK